jgi:hypothetical protein
MHNAIITACTKDDLIILKGHFNQRIIFLISVGLIYVFICLAIIGLLEITKTSYSQFLIITMMVILYCMFCLYHLFPRWKEIQKGQLLLMHEIIQNKEVKQHYLYTTSFINDVTKQPKIMKYFLRAGSTLIEVEKVVYEQFTIGDKIAIYYSIRNKEIIRLANK